MCDSFQIRQEFQAILQTECKLSLLMDVVYQSIKINRVSFPALYLNKLIQKVTFILMVSVVPLLLSFYLNHAEHRNAVYLDLLSDLMFPRGLRKDTIFVKQFEVTFIYVCTYVWISAERNNPIFGLFI